MEQYFDVGDFRYWNPLAILVDPFYHQVTRLNPYGFYLGPIILVILNFQLMYLDGDRPKINPLAGLEIRTQSRNNPRVKLRLNPGEALREADKIIIQLDCFANVGIDRGMVLLAR